VQKIRENLSAKVYRSGNDPKDIRHFIKQVSELDDSLTSFKHHGSHCQRKNSRFPFTRNAIRKKNGMLTKTIQITMNGSFIQTFFADFFGSKRTIKVNKFVLKPLITFFKLTGKSAKLNVHENSVYHRNSVVGADRFCKVFQNASQLTVNVLISDRMKVIEDYGQRLRPIIETIIFIGRQNFAFRSRKNDSRIDLEIKNFVAE
jgi:hypothetical protein